MYMYNMLMMYSVLPWQCVQYMIYNISERITYLSAGGKSARVFTVLCSGELLSIGTDTTSTSLSAVVTDFSSSEDANNETRGTSEVMLGVGVGDDPLIAVLLYEGSLCNNVCSKLG